MRLSILPFLFIAVPLTEITVFILVGSQIGVLPTIALVIATAVLGTILMRVQGFGALRRIQQAMETGETPGRELVHGVMILLAGMLLLTPGFVTDTLGFLLFIPAIREAAFNFLKSRVVMVTPGGGRHATGGGPGMRRSGTIDLDEDDFRRQGPADRERLP